MSVISRVGDFCTLRFYLCIYRYGSPLSVYSTLRRILAASSGVSNNKFQLLSSLLVSPYTNKSTKDSLKFHFTTQLNWQPVYFKLAQLSRRKGRNYADSQAHSQAGSQACRYLGCQKRGVNEIGEASPSSSVAKQNNFYPVLLMV